MRLWPSPVPQQNAAQQSACHVPEGALVCLMLIAVDAEESKCPSGVFEPDSVGGIDEDEQYDHDRFTTGCCEAGPTEYSCVLCRAALHALQLCSVERCWSGVGV